LYLLVYHRHKSCCGWAFIPADLIDIVWAVKMRIAPDDVILY